MYLPKVYVRTGCGIITLSNGVRQLYPIQVTAAVADQLCKMHMVLGNDGELRKFAERHQLDGIEDGNFINPCVKSEELKDVLAFIFTTYKGGLPFNRDGRVKARRVSIFDACQPMYGVNLIPEDCPPSAVFTDGEYKQEPIRWGHFKDGNIRRFADTISQHIGTMVNADCDTIERLRFHLKDTGMAAMQPNAAPYNICGYAPMQNLMYTTDDVCMLDIYKRVPEVFTQPMRFLKNPERNREMLIDAYTNLSKMIKADYKDDDPIVVCRYNAVADEHEAVILPYMVFELSKEYEDICRAIDKLEYDSLFASTQTFEMAKTESTEE